MAARLYQRLPTAKEAKALGVPLKAYAAQKPILVWPENRKAVLLFQLMGKEWCYGGMGGATRLDKSALERFERLAGIRPRERTRTFRDLLVLEDAALETMHPPKD